MTIWLKTTKPTILNDNIILNVQSIEINDECTSDNQAANKEYVDYIITHESLITNTRNNDMNDTKLLNLDSITINRNPSLDNEVVNKSYVDSKTDNFSQTFDNSRNEHVLSTKRHIDMNDFNIEDGRFMCIRHEPPRSTVIRLF